MRFIYEESINRALQATQSSKQWDGCRLDKQLHAVTPHVRPGKADFLQLEPKLAIPSCQSDA